ncbi:phytanoyl-CoA dioxygenase family protein [Paucibacter sp. APW11]|uniref:Phytanoyl-CoA dioxygenase family protein n=1 Tax=Roseateles aquae TaxID=3077235 RepID=A0ABU3PCN8_9BURK|nr:phytanoyl-CoA dioxygenase family protein [Paucibacter sp. APW11]MDT9000341.1 phytanoyl-CoA dioxygenase family protein [Paucibacter sp. APW11]
MIQLKTRRGLTVHVPETDAEDPSPKFAPADTSAILDYYRENGYVVIRGLFDGSTCDAIRALWDAEIKAFDGFIYRQASAVPERNILNSQGWVMNPILNLQSVDPHRFPKFRHCATENILTSAELSQAFNAVLGEAPKIVQSMYFEGNTATSEHQDSFYLDSEHIGSMAAAWVALEDISPTAGRFFVCPKSHKTDYVAHNAANSIVGDYESYFVSIIDKVRQLNMEIRAPKLDRGDVLLWNALTIHGSLDSHDPLRSRSSITCHAIAQSHRFLQLHTRIRALKTDRVGHAQIARPKDLALLKNRVIFWVETNFPHGFAWLKKNAIRLLMKRNTATARAVG